MTEQRFVDTTFIRERFAETMSLTYQTKVPQYGTLLELVTDIIWQTLEEQPVWAE